MFITTKLIILYYINDKHGKIYFFDEKQTHKPVTVNTTDSGFDFLNIFIYSHGLKATQHAMPPEFGEKW